MKSDFEAYLRAHIHPVDTSGRYERMLRQTLAGLPEDGLSRVGIRRIGVRRAWRTAVVLAALCALSVGGVAYGLSRGALSFNEDFGWGTPIVSQPGAEAFLVSGALAHVSLAHVDVDVLEAVCDGTELRVVYSVKNRAGEAVTRAQDALLVPGAQEDGVYMCDYVRVNGQDAFFDDVYEAEGGEPGQVLTYLQTNLAAWGVNISGARELTIGLPLLPRKAGASASPTLDFAIPVGVAPELVREAALTGEIEGVTLANSSFSPVRGYVELELRGALSDAEPTGFCRASAPDGTAIECHAVLLKKEDGGWRVGLAMMPPVGEWPERLALTVELCLPDEDINVEIALR